MIENPDKEALAAEYVLGTLDSAERVQAQKLIASDPAFADAVRDWERRLGELNVLVTPVEPPPAVHERIKARIASGEPIIDAPPEEPVVAEAAPAAEPTAEPAAEPIPVIEPAPPTRPETPAQAEPPKRPEPPPVAPVRMAPERSADIVALTRRAGRWRGIALATGALAAAFAGLVVMRELKPDLMPDPLKPTVLEKTVEVVKIVEVPSPKPAQYVAVLQRDAASPAFLLTFDLERRTLTVRTVGAERQAGKSYELWLVSDRFAAPRSLGVISNEEFTQRPQLANYDAVTINRATYAVSLEPEGGSPTGSPTGPVLYTGKLLQATPPSFAAPSP
jgi:anti-sigma-K factor RskA